MFDLLLLINISSSLFMTGLIWFVQIVHYPSFLDINAQDLPLYHKNHIKRTGYVVIPPMLIELITSIWLVIAFKTLWDFNIAGLVLVVLIWISTFILQAPMHQRLQELAEPRLIKKLVYTNWIRTFLWSFKSLVGLYILLI
ncbi:hypothetical protein [Fodinibius halophilus]|uniref:DUF1772 domain-containing protein n=1 Tax=Fodinibius halophilus TaxID=1736908 RepID=A0A6M1TDY6_9BACT|nr:hypothetical protein [Fodinibius halophilus]NGP88402.1 hypothetical protein [Fodinibius halophilus]